MSVHVVKVDKVDLNDWCELQTHTHTYMYTNTNSMHSGDIETQALTDNLKFEGRRLFRVIRMPEHLIAG